MDSAWIQTFIISGGTSTAEDRWLPKRDIVQISLAQSGSAWVVNGRFNTIDATVPMAASFTDKTSAQAFADALSADVAKLYAISFPSFEVTPEA